MSGPALDLTIHEVVDLRWIKRTDDNEPAVLEVITIGGVRNRLAFMRARPAGDSIASENDDPPRRTA